jgi:hypothetical protein
MKLNKYVVQEAQKAKSANAHKGEGLHVFRNRTKSDIILDKLAVNNVKIVKPGQEFQGDSYFMKLVNEERTCVLVRTIISPDEERITKKMEEKLIVDQPDIVTTEGTVEHVVVGKEQVKPLNESPCCPNGCSHDCHKKDVLITEDPLDGVDILG